MLWSRSIVFYKIETNELRETERLDTVTLSAVHLVITLQAYLSAS